MPQDAALKVTDPPSQPKDELGVLSLKRTRDTLPADPDASVGTLSLKRAGKNGQPARKESESTWDKLWKGAVSPEAATKAITLGLPIPKPGEYAKQAAKARSEGRSGAAALADLEGYTSAFYQTAGSVVSSLTSLGSAALIALPIIGELGPGASVGMKLLGRAARLPGQAAAVGFGAQGFKIAATPQQPGENQYDAFWRRNLGLSAFLGSTHAAWSGAKGSLQGFLKRQFNLSDDLASKVTSQVNKIEEVRKQTTGTVSQADEATRGKIRALQESLQTDLAEVQKNSSTRITGIRAHAEQAIEEGKGKISDLQKQRLRQGANTVADIMQAFLQEKARVGKPFDDIAAKIKGTVAKQDEVRGVITKAFQDTGVDVAQIPSRAIELLKSEEEGGARHGAVTLRTPDGHYLEVDNQYVQGFVEKGYTLVSDVTPEGAINFDRITRIREDVSQAANSSKDTRVKAALFKAHDDLTDFQENIAEKHKLGTEYKTAKNNYKMFVRGIGSDMVHTFLDASDAEAQAIAPKIAEMTTRQNAEALQTVLRAAGVDTRPLAQIIQDMDAVDAAIKETQRVAGTMASEQAKSAAAATSGLKADVGQDIARLKKSAAEQTRAATRQERLDIRGIKKEPVVPGQDVEALKGKPNQELLAMRMRHQMANSHASGFVNTWALSSVIYGLIKMATGSLYGAPLAGVGAMRLELPRLVRNPAVQDWIIRQSGVQIGTPEAARIRRGILALSPVLTKALKTGIPQAAAVKAAQGQLSVPEMPQ